MWAGVPATSPAPCSARSALCPLIQAETQTSALDLSLRGRDGVAGCGQWSLRLKERLPAAASGWASSLSVLGVWGGPVFRAAVGQASRHGQLTAVLLRQASGLWPGMSPWGSPGRPLHPSWTRGLCSGWGSPWGPHWPLLLPEPGRGREGEAVALAACPGAGILSPCLAGGGAHCLPVLSPGQSGRPDPIGRQALELGLSSPATVAAKLGLEKASHLLPPAWEPGQSVCRDPGSRTPF